MSNYKTPPVALDRGAGATVWDVDGREYTDLLGGIATTILGHAHPKVVEAITAQAAEARARLQPGHARAGPAAGRAAARPGRPARAASSSATPAPRPTRRRSRSAGSPGGPRWSPPRASFHGRTMGALALTGQPAKAAAFAPLPGGVRYVPYGDADALAGGRRPSRPRWCCSSRCWARAACCPRPPGYLAVGRGDRGRRRRAVRRRRGADRHGPHRLAGSCTRPTASPPTSSRWPRRSAAGCRWARSWRSARRPTC